MKWRAKMNNLGSAKHVGIRQPVKCYEMGAKMNNLGCAKHVGFRQPVKCCEMASQNELFGKCKTCRNSTTSKML